MQVVVGKSLGLCLLAVPYLEEANYETQSTMLFYSPFHACVRTIKETKA